ncbi:MAG: hypothetical protein P4L64_14440 [Caulobacteraceae bacterium]|nr:hypothetical protein [Caulobacteraceae bacterium]
MTAGSKRIALAVVLVGALGVAVASARAQGVAPSAAGDGLITASGDHGWLNCPGSEDAGSSDLSRRFYPEGARALAVEGWAKVQCKISATGRPLACIGLSEYPEGFGFGDAGAQMGCVFRFKPASARDTGAPAERIFTFRTTFKMPK